MQNTENYYIYKMINKSQSKIRNIRAHQENVQVKLGFAVPLPCDNFRIMVILIFVWLCLLFVLGLFSPIACTRGRGEEVPAC